MDEDFLISTIIDQTAYTSQVELEDDHNTLFMDFLVLHLTGDVTLSYWFEESNDGMTWKETDRIDGEAVEAGTTVPLLGSVLGGVLARAGFLLVDSGGGGVGDIILRVTLNPTRR